MFPQCFENKCLRSALYIPGSSVGKAQVAWPAGSAFDALGWLPDGEVRGAYKVSTLSTTDFRVTGTCDVDGDGNGASYTSSKSLNAALTTTNDTY